MKETWFSDPVSVWQHIDIALVRLREDWESVAGANRVQLGAGRKMIRDWTNLDFPEWDAHSKDSSRWRIPFDDGDVAEIASYFTLDHLEPWAVVRVLREAQRVLKVGGTFSIIVPHYSSQLAHECIMHKSQFGIDTWRNIFSERQYDHLADGGSADLWRLRVGANFIFGLTERNTILVTQLIKTEA